jgi:LysM repeat protein
MTLSSIAAGGAAKSMLAVTISMHPAAAAHGTHYVTVKPGDTLSSISQSAFGKEADWPSLWWFNRHSVPNPSSIRVGQRLSLPNSHTVPAWLSRRAMAATGVTGASEHTATASPMAASAAPTAESTTVYSGSGSFQSCVIRAESNGDASAVNPSSGAGGLYGFLPSTWQALGYSGLPEDASVSEQNAAYAKEYAQSGGSAWSAYDGC